VGESLEAIVGQVTMRIPVSIAAALAVSRVLPPPIPMEISAPLVLMIDIRLLETGQDGFADYGLYSFIPQQERFFAEDRDEAA